jgi:hypothetical protein
MKVSFNWRRERVGRTSTAVEADARDGPGGGLGSGRRGMDPMVVGEAVNEAPVVQAWTR